MWALNDPAEKNISNLHPKATKQQHESVLCVVRCPRMQKPKGAKSNSNSGTSPKEYPKSLKTQLSIER